MPGTLEAYYQEAGRAGRDGKPAEVYLLHAFPDRFTHEFFIKGAYPERRARREGLRACSRAAPTRRGAVSLEPAAIAASLPGKVSDREVESALRVLIQAGAIRSEPESGGRVFVRLLATPERIKRELGADRALELGLLRALWRVARRCAERRRADRSRRTAAGLRRRRRRDAAARGARARPVPRVAPARRRRPRHQPASSALGVSARLGGDRSPSQERAVQARRDAAVRVRDRLSPRLRAPLLRRSRGGEGLRRLRQLPRHARRDAPRRRSRRLRSRARRSEGTRRVARQRSAASRWSWSRAPPTRSSSSGCARCGRASPARSRCRRTSSSPTARLLEIAVRRPKSPYALGEIRGVGPMKIEKYGERFLELVRTSDETEAA